MVRPKSNRKIACHPDSFYFKPQGISGRKLQEEVLTLDELESLRLADVEGLYHEQAAVQMGVSRATFGRIVQAARRKIATALVKGRAIRVEGGPVEYVDENGNGAEPFAKPVTTTATTKPAVVATTP